MRLNADLSEVSEDLTELMPTAVGTPISLTNNVPFIAPSDGYIAIIGVSSGTKQGTLKLTSSDILLLSMSNSEVNVGANKLSAYARKGLSYTYHNVSNTTCQFIPLE